MWQAPLRPLAIVCVAGLALSGCGTNGAGDGADPEATDSSDGEEQSPLFEYLGDDVGFLSNGRITRSMSISDLTDEELQQARQVEELVAACMQEAGFEYVPSDPSANADREDPFAEANSLPPEEFAREYGYGITTLRPPAPDEETADPNQEIREGLSDAAIEAYNQALYGAAAQVSEGGGAVVIATPGQTIAPEDQGCLGSASNEVYGESDVMGGPGPGEFDGLFEDIQALRERIDSDPRLVAANDAWAACMAEAGYSEFKSTSEPADDVISRMNELYGGEPQDDEGGPTIIGGEGDPGGGVSIGDADVDIDEAALAELKEYEIAVATADYDCAQEYYTDVQHDVSWEYEEQFVAENLAELERYRDSAGQRPAARFGGGG